MPLRYADGSVAEHMKTREAAGVFDVSHLGIVRVSGNGGAEALNEVFTNDLNRVGPGRAQYTLLVNDEGGVEDDVIVWWLRADEFWVLPNASNVNLVVDAIGAAGSATEVEVLNGEMALIAVQGPLWSSVLESAAIPSAARPGPFQVVEEAGIIVAGTGYTGERGCEVLIPAESASDIWSRLVSAAESYEGGPAGLVARDTLRLEMGYPLHGHEMDATVTPWESGLGWVVSLDKPRFNGRNALEASRSNPRWELVGLEMLGREIPRSGCPVKTQAGDGIVTSGNLSPLLGHGVALARVTPGTTSPGDPAEIEIRGQGAKAVCVKPPFVDR